MKGMERQHIIETLAERYPQLTLPISAETRHGEEYKNTVLRGVKSERRADFGFSPDDRFERIETPAGSAEVLTISERADFEHCIRALAYRCEPAELPKTMGASTISGLINWEKIRRHEEEYLAAGGDDWDEEFARFTSVRENFRDTLIVLSRGPYSAVSAERADYAEEKWLDLSLTIRKYHELAHFVSRRLYPDNQDAVRDEVLADMNGVIAALGQFDAHLTGLFLGVENGEYIGGRLENYVPRGELSAAVERVRKMLAVLDAEYSGASKPFEILTELESKKIFL